MSVAVAILSVLAWLCLAGSFWFSQHQYKKTMDEALAGWGETLDSNKQLLALCEEQEQRIRELEAER